MKLQSNINYSSYGINQNRMSKPKQENKKDISFTAMPKPIQNLVIKAGEKAKDSTFNIYFNAFVGTAAVAPVMIAFGAPAIMKQIEKIKLPNPFSKNKEDKLYIKNPFANDKIENRYYSALRQPVSAILAVALQAPITKFTDGLVEKSILTGKFGNSFMEKTANGLALNSKGTGFKRMMTIVLSLITLVPQVKALNWVYPRFVNLVAPKLAEAAGKKADKNPVQKEGGNK